MGRFVARVLRALGAVGAVAGCGAMAAMLPGVAASVFGGLGLAGSSAIGRGLAHVAEPLFVVSAVLLVAGALACSWLVTIMVGMGSVLAYLSMFVLTTGRGDMSMARMGAMGGAHANGVLFIVGALLIVASFVVTPVRRRRGTCSPVLSALSR